jgi:hypothetical protein
MKRLIDESFEVAVPLTAAWDHLAQIEGWPSWAKHIKSVIRNPAGPLSADTEGTINLSIGVATTFKMTEFEPMRHWKWRGGLLGAQLDYDHVFTALARAVYDRRVGMAGGDRRSGLRRYLSAQSAPRNSASDRGNRNGALSWPTIASTAD